MVVSAYLLANTLTKTIPTNQIIKVRGVSERVIELVRVNWTLSISYIDMELDSAYKKVDDTAKHILTYLNDKGVNKQNIHLSSYSQKNRSEEIIIDEFRNYQTRFIGHQAKKVYA